MNTVVNLIVNFTFSVLKMKSKTNVLAFLQAVAGASIALLPFFDGVFGGNTQIAGYLLIAKSIVDAILRQATTKPLEDKLS